jgi:hypothetical protein
VVTGACVKRFEEKWPALRMRELLCPASYCAVGASLSLQKCRIDRQGQWGQLGFQPQTQGFVVQAPASPQLELQLDAPVQARVQPLVHDVMEQFGVSKHPTVQWPPLQFNAQDFAPVHSMMQLPPGQSAVQVAPC